jgi:hypothetical protein
MVWKWVMGVSVAIGFIGMVMAVLTMAGLPFGIYDLTTGGYLRGAQTLFLFVLALYCLWRVQMGA